MNSREAVDRFNVVRDWLKHETRDTDDTCDITDFDAWAMLVRAVTKLHAVSPASETPMIADFVDYSRQHYAEDMGRR